MGAATRDGSTIFGKNSDKEGDATLVGPQYAMHREIHVVTDFVDASGMRVLGLAAAGKLGLKIGVNSAGVAGGTNYGHTAEAARRLRIGATDLHDQLAQDRAMRLRRGLEHADARGAVRDVLDSVIDTPSATPGNLEFADASQAFVVESAYTESALVTVHEGIAVRANRFEVLAALSGGHPSSDARYARIEEHLRAREGDLTADDLQLVSRDHANGPGDLSVCIHGYGHRTRAMGAMTVRLASGEAPEFAFAAGTPCVACPSADGVMRGRLTIDAPPVPEAFANGAAWRQHYLPADPPAV